MRIAISTLFVDHVDHAIGRHQFELDLGIALEKFADHRRELMGRESERRRHPQQAVGRAALVGHLGFQCLDLAHDAARGGIEGLAVGGQAEGAGGALQQPHAQPRLEPGHELADRRGREAKRRRGGRKPLESTTRTKAAISLA